MTNHPTNDKISHVSCRATYVVKITHLKIPMHLIISSNITVIMSLLLFTELIARMLDISTHGFLTIAQMLKEKHEERHLIHKTGYDDENH